MPLMATTPSATGHWMRSEYNTMFRSETLKTLKLEASMNESEVAVCQNFNGDFRPPTIGRKGSNLLGSTFVCAFLLLP